MNAEKYAHALANPNRLLILDWLKDPLSHFPPQIHADPVETGVCGTFFAEKLAVSAPTASVHLRILVDAGLLHSTRIGRWTYFRRNETAFATMQAVFSRI